MRRLVQLMLLVCSLAGCGASQAIRATRHKPVAHSGRPAGRRQPPPRSLRSADRARSAARRRHSDPVAFVSAETENRLIELALPSGAVRARIPVPAGPQYVAAEAPLQVVSSPPAGAVSIVQFGRIIKEFRSFSSPHLVAIAPDGEHVYVTDDARGTLSVIDLADNRVIATVSVGAGAHHMASDPDQTRLWIALGEVATKIVMLDTSNIERPRVVGSFDPGFAAHDLAFSPDGQRVWISAADGPDVTVFDAWNRHVLFRVPVGPGPQHIVMEGSYAYLSSGYGSTIERVDEQTGRIVNRARTPYGSFELDAADGYVVTASLLNGRVAIFTPSLKLLRIVQVAPATRDIEISTP
jgi:YVTN family beta-propeller protein